MNGTQSYLKSLRMAKGMTLRQVAEACGISFMTVSNLERGKHAHGSKAAVKVLRFYGIMSEKALRDLGVCPCCSGSGKPGACGKGRSSAKSPKVQKASIGNSTKLRKC